MATNYNLVYMNNDKVVEKFASNYNIDEINEDNKLMRVCLVFGLWFGGNYYVTKNNDKTRYENIDTYMELY